MRLSAVTRRSFLQMGMVAGIAAGGISASTRQALAETGDAGSSASEVKRVRSCCRACGKMECGVWVTVKDGRAVKVEGDPSAFHSSGNCCSKSQSSIQAAYHPDRLHYPMKRTNEKGEDDPGWVRISWDEAFQTIGQKFNEVKERYGGPSLFCMTGTSRIWCMAGIIGWPRALGTPNTMHAYQVCKGPRHFATQMTCARAFSYMATVDRPSVYVQWGGASELSNYDDSCRTTVDVAKKAATHILVDPRQTNLGRMADVWMNLRPGTDAAIAMSWAHVIIENKLWDDLYVKRWTDCPFLVCEDIEPSGWTERYDMTGSPWELKTKLLKESDLVEGGNPKHMMVWDTLSDSLTYFDVESGLWEGETWKRPEAGRPALQKNLVPGVAPGWVPDPTPFNPLIDPALFGEFEVTLKDGRKSVVRPVLDRYAEACALYAPEKAEEITGVPAKEIERAAIAYATRVDPSTGYGNGGIHYMLAIEHAGNAIQNVRSIDALTMLTGNMDTPGGHRGVTQTPIAISPTGGDTLFAADVPGAPFPDYEKTLGYDKFPMSKWFGGFADSSSIWEAIETGEPYPVVAGICQSGDFMNQGNALYSWDVLNSLDFLVDADLWHAPTSDAADILLPVCHWLELSAPRMSQGASGAYGATCQCIEPPAECRWDPDVLVGICKGMGVPFLPDDEANTWPDKDWILDDSVKDSGLTWEEYRDNFQKNGWLDAKAEYPEVWGTYRRYEMGLLKDGKPGWKTPTRKHELWSTIMESHHPEGTWNFPTFTEPQHSPVSDPERCKEYPFVITTGRRIPVYFHNEHRQLPWCRELWPVPRVEINPVDAQRLGIEQGDWVWIETPEGKVRQTADLYYGVAEGVVNCEHQWWYPEINQAGHGFELSCINCITDRRVQDPHSGSTNLRAYLCTIYKATPENSPFGNPVPCGKDGTEIIHTSDDPRLKEWLPTYEGRK